MDQKRELSSVDLAAVVTELSTYRGAKVDKAYLYDDSLLRLRMRDFDRGRTELLVDVGETKRAHLSAPENVPDAPGRPPNFAMMLRNRISGADLASVEQYGFDRIVTLRFERPDGDTLVVAELFGDGNIAVLNADREVLACLETVRLKSRTVAPGAVYDYPEARYDPMTADRAVFGRRMDDSDSDVVRTIATRLNLGGTWAEELCKRAGVPYNQSIDETSEAEYDELFRVLTELREKLQRGAFDPRVYYEERTTEDGDGEEERHRVRVDVTPLPLEEYEHLASEQFDTFNAALDDYFTHFEADVGEVRARRSDDGPDFESEIAKYQRIIDQQQGAIENFDEQAASERERAETLYARYDLVDNVIRAVQNARREDVPWDEIEERFTEGAERGIEAAEAVVDVDPAESTVTLDLDGVRVTVDTRMGVEKNADQRYQAAKRIEEKKEGALDAIEDTHEQLEDVKRRRDEWEADDEPDESDDEETEDIDWLTRANVPIRRDEQWYERFRWFRTSDGFLVLGGRNADQNEELVKKYMDGGDRFFHTQAPGAPVTVLKATGPSEPAREVDFPDSTLEQTAQFAVTYSNAWKDGLFTGDVYMVEPDQVSKTPESGEYVEKGSFVVRGERTYFEDTSVGVSIGVSIEPQSQVLGGPPAAIQGQTVTSIRLEPGQYAQNDIAKMLYRELKDRFADQTFLRKVASPDRIQEFCPAGGSRIVED